jgi:hypothetical protein
MKLGRWKVLGLAGVLALGYVAQAEAVQIKVDEDTFADFGLKMKIFYQNLDERSKAKNGTSGDWRQNKFDVENTRIYFIGQVNKLVQFYGEFDEEKSNSNSTSVNEAGINFAFAKEFQVLVGKIRKSFTRIDLTRFYSKLIPTPYFYDPQKDAFDEKTRIINLFTDNDTDVNYGLMVHGDLAGGMFTYRIGVYNNDQRVKKNRDVQWNVRVEFQPLMLGFKPESAATITSKVLDTYLGKKDILTIGLGYMSARKPMTYRGNFTKDKTVEGWTADLTFEKKFGNLVPNFQIGYVSLRDTHVDPVSNKRKDSDAWYVQGQLLFDQVVGFGKPALAVRYDTTTNDERINVDGTADDAKLERWGAALNYYIKGQDARVSLGFDYAKYKDGSKDFLKYVLRKQTGIKYEDSLTDWYLFLQMQF